MSDVGNTTYLVLTNIQHLKSNIYSSIAFTFASSLFTFALLLKRAAQHLNTSGTALEHKRYFRKTKNEIATLTPAWDRTGHGVSPKYFY